ncbi:hypothetical protein [Sulfitobacter guttiformis]|uniref:Uncharacterized protein n=1 Tax=Sulfitobacter guttiformis TaxID=74349 RepID=A0A420DPV1_9RHOB|nr:hypothetical protein [Sulfitobacter guttiformis]RKE96183.1 hypothetical protein C8N30_0736 [Sulfitobacter guttiformis]
MSGFTAVRQHHRWRTCGNFRAASARSEVFGTSAVGSLLPFAAIVIKVRYGPFVSIGIRGGVLTFAANRTEVCYAGQSGLLPLRVFLT